MTFTPIIPSSGILGFTLLERTEAGQREVFERQPEVARDVDFFTREIANVRTAEELVSDRRLLRVALGAFGLDDEIDKRAFLRKMLEEGTESQDAFVNRFVDPRFKSFVQAFGFGDSGGVRTGLASFPSEITSRFTERQFEIAVGEQDENLRLALNFRREIQVYANASDPEGVAWFSAMGDLPVRRVLEGALGLPSSLGQLDIDRQRDVFRDKNDGVFGGRSLAVFNDPEVVDTAIKRFLARAEIDSGPTASTPGFAALTVLSNGIGAIGAQNLFLSRF